MSEFDERDVLLKAASLVEQAWWANRETVYFEGDEEQAVCAVLALNRACSALGAHYDLKLRAQDRLAEHLGLPLDMPALVGLWNDAQPDRFTVAEAMRRAAE